MSYSGFVDASITAQNTFSDPMAVPSNTRVTLALGGISGTTVFLQHRFVGETDSDWKDAAAGITANGVTVYTTGAACELRAGVKTGGFGSGTAVLQLRW